MSNPFQKVMRDLNNVLKATYKADKVAIIPGWVSYKRSSAFVIDDDDMLFFFPILSD